MHDDRSHEEAGAPVGEYFAMLSRDLRGDYSHRDASNVSPNILESICQITWSLAEATARSKGGVWAHNLLPALEPCVARICSRPTLLALSRVVRDRSTAADGFALLSASLRSRHFDAMLSYLDSGPDDVADSARQALITGLDFVALIGIIAPDDVAPDLHSFVRGATSIASHRSLTPAEGHAIVELRKSIALDATNVAARARLFELESK